MAYRFMEADVISMTVKNFAFAPFAQFTYTTSAWKCIRHLVTNLTLIKVYCSYAHMVYKMLHKKEEKSNTINKKMTSHFNINLTLGHK
jgi:hypothetical protein